MLNTLTTSPDSVDELVSALRVLCDRTRLRLLGALQSGEVNVTSLCEQLDLPQPTVSHHLGLLRTARLVRNRREGKQVFYCLNDAIVSNLGDHGGVKIHAGAIALQILTERRPTHEDRAAPPTLHNGHNGAAGI
jgi:DNA-binding transcriptional ArsR family regulator